MSTQLKIIEMMPLGGPVSLYNRELFSAARRCFPENEMQIAFFCETDFWFFNRLLK